MRRKYKLSAAVAALFMPAIIAAASENISVSQYYSDDEKITAYVHGIDPEELTARIAGIKCKTENDGSVYYDAEKYETIFLVDSSGSVKSFSDEIDTFLRECIDKKMSNEYYSIGMFAEGNIPQYVADAVSDQYELEKSLDKLDYSYESTYIFDNLINTVDKLYSEGETVYKRIVLFTDGNENNPNGMTIDDVLSEISEKPIPIYTVTLQTESNGNVEKLKTIAGLSRRSNAADIRILNGDNVSGKADILFDDAKNTYRINITPPHELLDGSVKALEISDRNAAAEFDIRMAMADLEESTENGMETISAEMNNDSAVSDGNKAFYITIIIASVGLTGAAAGIVLIILRSRKNKEKNVLEKPQMLSDDEKTMIIGNGHSGQTEMIFTEDISTQRVIILRDCADSVRTFEVPLSSQGVIIGRSHEYANVVIDYDKSVSRRHCRIYLKNGKSYISDLGSGNKTYVNDSEVTNEVPLNNLDEIKIGRTRLKVTIR